MRALICLAKAPLPGYAKTRLVAAGVRDEAWVARLAEAFLRDTLRTCRRVRDATRFLVYTPESARGYFAELDPSAQPVPQVEGDLGRRMDAAFRAAFDAGASAAVLIGSDAPHLGAATLEAAFEALREADVVLGPTDDGGYYLIGLRAQMPALFERVEWSTPRVFAQTLERARAEHLRVAQLAEAFDVDSPRELERLRELLDADCEPCPHTAQVLREIDVRPRASLRGPFPTS